MPSIYEGRTATPDEDQQRFDDTLDLALSPIMTLLNREREVFARKVIVAEVMMRIGRELSEPPGAGSKV